MIKATELRLGNLLIHKGEVVYVTTLTLDVDDEREESIGFCKAGQTTDEILGWDSTLDLQGIEITPEWLERSGFMKSHLEDIWFTMQLPIRFKEGVASYERLKASYVHELQNIHALTGTELDIKI